MEGLSIKLKTAELEFELKTDYFEEEDKDFIREIIRMIDRKTTTANEQMGKEDLKEKYKVAAEGYNALSNEIEGFHNGIDEYIAQEVEEELKSGKENEKEEIQEDLDLKEETESEVENDESNHKVGGYYHKDTEDPSIRLNIDNKELYQTFYICPKCKNKGKRYIPKHAIQTICHNCYHQMKLTPASFNGFPGKDKFGNIFVAGDFKATEETQMEDETKINIYS